MSSKATSMVLVFVLLTSIIGQINSVIPSFAFELEYADEHPNFVYLEYEGEVDKKKYQIERDHDRSDVYEPKDMPRNDYGISDVYEPKDMPRNDYGISDVYEPKDMPRNDYGISDVYEPKDMPRNDYGISDVYEPKDMPRNERLDKIKACEISINEELQNLKTGDRYILLNII